MRRTSSGQQPNWDSSMAKNCWRWVNSRNTKRWASSCWGAWIVAGVDVQKEAASPVNPLSQNQMGIEEEQKRNDSSLELWRNKEMQNL